MNIQRNDTTTGRGGIWGNHAITLNIHCSCATEHQKLRDEYAGYRGMTPERGGEGFGQITEYPMCHIPTL